MEILGADIQESLIKEAKIRLGQSLIKTNVNYLLKNLADVSGMEQYNLVYSHFFLVDCALPESMFQNMYALVKEGGTLCCFEPIYQTDGLNMYLPFLGEEDKSALLDIHRDLLINIPGSKGLERDFAIKLPDLFIKNHLADIKIDLISSFEIAYQYTSQRKRYILLNSNKLLKSKDKFREVLAASPLYSGLSEDKRNRLFELEVKIAERIVKDTKSVFSSCYFTAGQMLAVKGIKGDCKR